MKIYKTKEEKELALSEATLKDGVWVGLEYTKLDGDTWHRVVVSTSIFLLATDAEMQIRKVEPKKIKAFNLIGMLCHDGDNVYTIDGLNSHRNEFYNMDEWHPIEDMRKDSVRLGLPTTPLNEWKTIEEMEGSK